MQVFHENFIGIYEGAFSSEYCNKVITYHNWAAKNNRVWNREEAETVKKDESTVLSPMRVEEIVYTPPNFCNLANEFNSIFWDTCYKDYADTYSVLHGHHKHTIFCYKVQKTLPGGGYHIWHCEDGEREHRIRLGTYILFLNDVEEGGETEFLYLSKRIPAKQGTLIIFPSSFPWAHRGNPPLSGEKYIMTGWIEFC